MRRDHRRFRDPRATLVVVGLGSPDQAADFVRKLSLPFPVLADPDRAAYATFGLDEGRPDQFLNPATGRAVLRAVVGGAGGGRVIGNARQLPGAFVIDPTGTVRFAKPALHAADTASTAELLAAVGNVRSGR